ncbi:SRSF2 [Symbiodinium sp. CCMP2456]|nr:SRSF2 [Symbiodinium sp. CCMP2456]
MLQCPKILARAVRARHSVKIDNITCTQDEVISVKEELREKFSKFGEIGDVYIPRDRNFAFVRYLEKRDAEDAVDAMDGKDIMGQEISVSLSMQVRGVAGMTPGLSAEPRYFTIEPLELPRIGPEGMSQGEFSSVRGACWATPADHIRRAQLRENGVGVEGAGEMSREAVAVAGVDSIKRLQWRWPACACPKASGRQPLCGNFQPAKLSPQAINSSNFSFLVLVSSDSGVWHRMTRTQPTSSLSADGPQGCSHFSEKALCGFGSLMPSASCKISSAIGAGEHQLEDLLAAARALGSRIHALLFSPP